VAEEFGRELLERAASLGSATIHEAAGRIGALPAGIRPVDPSSRVAGPARTVAGAPGDNLAIHHAIAVARAGGAGGGAAGGGAPRPPPAAVWGYWGEIMSTGAASRRLGGLVLQGGSRDHAALPAVGFPVFSLGACIRGTVKHQPDPVSRIGMPVRIGDVDVHDGDLVVGDIDGVVVIPAGRAAEAVDAGFHREEHEAEVLRRLGAGETTIEIYGLV
jgi:4-hydroxy-4-methyl-2-oxoglutarate aldolase